MARVTVEDCVDKVDNRFELVLLASHRARQVSGGSEITIDRDNDKNPVVALREIAEETLSPADLFEDLIHSHQHQVEIDEPESDQPDGRGMAAEARIDSVPEAPVFSDAEDKPEESVTFDQISEEELLAGIEGLVPPEKSDDF